jgi:hypothetical protein
MYVKCYSSIKLVEFTFFFNIIFMFLISISRLIIKSFFFLLDMLYLFPWDFLFSLDLMY